MRHCPPRVPGQNAQFHKRRGTWHSLLCCGILVSIPRQFQSSPWHLRLHRARLVAYTLRSLQRGEQGLRCPLERLLRKIPAFGRGRQHVLAQATECLPRWLPVSVLVHPRTLRRRAMTGRPLWLALFLASCHTAFQKNKMCGTVLAARMPGQQLSQQQVWIPVSPRPQVRWGCRWSRWYPIHPAAAATSAPSGWS